jgi:PQQ-dependent dehydrogenase (methanol/ethanol family)
MSRPLPNQLAAEWRTATSLFVITLALAVGPVAANAAAAPPNTDWMLLGNSVEMQHHSDLAQINESNVARLGLAWTEDIPSPDGLVGNPLVKDGVVFQSGPLGRIFATDIRTGVLRWKFDAGIDFSSTGFGPKWSSRYNRGLALWDNLALVGTGDCRVIAVDQKTGQKVWENQSCDKTGLYGITGAPRVGAGKVFIGNNCSESGTSRGYVDALDARTGKRQWRFYTVPDDPAKPQSDKVMSMAAATWGSGWYQKTKGCGSVWDAITYDPKLNLVFIGTGGPAPWPPTARGTNAGDELFTNAIVALNADTGAYVWHYSTTPHDGWNLEATMHIMVADLPIKGATRRVVLTAPKNGFFYVLDAKTGQFISANNPEPVNWASRIDSTTGRPVTLPDARYWEKPESTAIVSPGPLGAHGWMAMAFDPKRQLVYVPFHVIPTQMTVDLNADGGGTKVELYDLDKKDPKWESFGELVAWDPLRQTARWRVRSKYPVNGGVLHTAGDLVFEGTADGFLNAYGAATGKRLWSKPVSGAIQSAPTTVMVDGEQYVLVASGNNASMASGAYVTRFASTALTRAAPSRLLAFKLGGTAQEAAIKLTPRPEPPLPRPDWKVVKAGELSYERRACVDCHGRHVVAMGGSIPDLRRAGPETHRMFDQIVRGGLLSANGMPAFSEMSSQELNAVQAYILDNAWNDYEAQKKAND